jgi:transcriptional regulator with XRE-family HTH domain
MWEKFEGSAIPQKSMPTAKLAAPVLFAERVRNFRKERGISASTLSSAAAISRNTLHLIENKAVNAQLSTVERLSIALDVDPCDFFRPGTSTASPYQRTRLLQQTVATNIARLREQSRMSQESLVRATGLPRSYVWHIEKTTPDLSLETIERIAVHLDADVCTLLAEQP